MDPVNLSGTQNTPSECKNYAGIRSPAGCACCGLKDYPQNIPQAYCFTALCPGLSKCKSSQDHPQDNFAIPHPFLSSFPFQQHFFHNSIIPPNFCCFQKLSGDEGANPSHVQTRSEHKVNQHQASQKEKSDFAGTKRNANESAQKTNPVLGAETTFPSNPTESQPNNVFQRCVCGDSFPWACRPFIVPVLSYCFLWNSQTAAASLLPKTYNSYLSETLCQKNSKKEANQKYSCESDCQEQSHIVNQEPEKAALDKDHVSAETSQESLEVNRSSKTELKTEEQEESTELEENECMKNDFDGNYEEEEDESETGDDSELRDEIESVESLKIDESDTQVRDSSENLSKDLDTVSSTNLKSATKSSEHSLNDALLENPENGWVTGVNHMNPSIVSIEESPEKNSDSDEPDTSKTNLKEVVVKKCIKNFTVTDKISGAPSKDVQMSAAGDQGGESCDRHKIQTSFDESNEEILKESFKKDVGIEDSEPKVSPEKDGKIIQEIQSSGYKFKSGIAKLSNISNLRSSKTKTTKKCKNYSNEKQSNAVKLKHCCFPNKNANPKSESTSIIQKPKKCTFLQNPAPVKASGPETQKKSLNTRQGLKKENISQKPARAVNLSDNSQKAVKSLLRK